jgi:hypothetical protein
MLPNGLSLNKKPSDDINDTGRTGGWGSLLSHFARVAMATGANTLLLLPSVVANRLIGLRTPDEYRSIEIY